MEKSLNITLNSIIFPIEEDAYETLKSYLDSIEKYYADEEGEKEILKDIESSIAEKFSEKLKSTQQAIKLSDVEEIIKIMGTVNEITEAEEKNGNLEANAEKEEAPVVKKRLYRSSEDVAIAGVASGIAAYFGIDPVFVRILFLILIFVNGIGVLIYGIFWLAMPKAETNAQKLEMRGKPVNLSQIEQAVKEKAQAATETVRQAVGRPQTKNAFLAILNIPIIITKTLFVFLKNIFCFLFPALSIIIGIGVIIVSVLAILGGSILSSVLVFNISSPYIISDLPLPELAGNPLFYTSVIALYAACSLPMIFMTALGITMVRRKNSFRLFSSSIMVGIWIIAVTVFTVSIISLAPMIRIKVADARKENSTVKEYAYRDFHKLYLGDNLKLQVSKAESDSIKLKGNPADLDRLDFNIEDGQLQITKKERKGICIFCQDQIVTGEITMRELDSFVGINASDSSIKGFSGDLYISLGESATAKIDLQGTNVSGKLSGINSELSLSGTAETVNLQMDGSADLNIESFSAHDITLSLKTFSDANLSGQAENLTINASDMAEVSAFGLSAQNVQAAANDHSEVKVTAVNSMSATSSDSARIFYQGDPKKISQEENDLGLIRAGDSENDNRVYIKTDVKQYSPLMSSIRGIGLSPEFYGGDGRNFIFRFSTNQGYLIRDFDELDYSQEIDVYDKSEKIYWTYVPGEIELSTKTPIYVNVEVRPEGEDRTIANTRIEFVSDNTGVVTQKFEE